MLHLTDVSAHSCVFTLEAADLRPFCGLVLKCVSPSHTFKDRLSRVHISQYEVRRSCVTV